MTVVRARSRGLFLIMRMLDKEATDRGVSKDTRLRARSAANDEFNRSKSWGEALKAGLRILSKARTE